MKPNHYHYSFPPDAAFPSVCLRSTSFLSLFFKKKSLLPPKSTKHSTTKIHRDAPDGAEEL